MLIRDTFEYDLQEHQLDGIKWLSQGYQQEISRYLCDEPGMGKTVQAIEGLKELHLLGKGPKRTLIVCPKGLISWWTSELKRYNYDPIVISGSAVQRIIEWRAFAVNPPPIVRFTPKVGVISYDSLRIDAPKVVNIVSGLIILDEAHRVSNRRAKTTKAIQGLVTCWKCQVWMLSGTPMSRGVQDLWANLHLMDRELFSSYWKFINSWFHVEDGPYGKEILGLKSLYKEQLRELVAPYVLRRTKDISNMPPKTRAIEYIEMSREQSKVYREVEDEMVAELPSIGRTYKRDDFIIAENVLHKLMILRHLLIYPSKYSLFLGIGSALSRVFDWMIDNEESHVAIFSAFPSLFVDIAYQFEKVGFPKPLILRGSHKGKSPEDIIQEVQQKRLPLLISIRYAEGFSIPSISQGFFIGPEYVPRYNEQAENRIHRLSSEKPVDIKYLIHRNTIEEDIVEAVNTKQGNIQSLFEGNTFSHVGLKSVIAKMAERTSNQIALDLL